MRITALPALALAAALGSLASTAAHAQVADGPLFAATDNPVTATFLGSSIPFSSTLYWSTGPTAFDVQASSSSILSGSAPGSAIATPILSPGTYLFLSAMVNPIFGPPDIRSTGIMTTGGGNSPSTLSSKTIFGHGPNPFEFFGPHAAVFYEANNTALVGFPALGDGALTGDFSSFAIRFSVSNVMGSIGGGGGCR
jgi:hypothetical protein